VTDYSGTVIYPGADSPVADLFPHKAGGYITPESEAASQRFMAEVNRAHAATREGDRRLEGRIRSYELAARMQLAAPEALNLKAEPEHVLKLYGLDRGPQNWPKEINDEEETFYFAQKCLAARRLLERGVRFVQVWSGNDNGFPRRNWDSHESYGESDEWGYKPLDRKNPTEVYDVHATLLHLLGIDHEKLSFYHNGIKRRLTDVHGHVIEPLLA
jgi:hypothetical protein